MHPSFLSLFSFSSKPLHMCSLNSWNADQVDEKVLPFVMVSWKFNLNRVVHTTPYHHSFLQLSENSVFFHFSIQTSHSLFSKILVFVCSQSLQSLCLLLFVEILFPDSTSFTCATSFNCLWCLHKSILFPCVLISFCPPLYHICSSVFFLCLFK